MSILEGIGMVLIALVVIGGAAYGLNSAFSKAKVANTQQDLVTTRMQIQQLFSGATNYSGLTNEVAINAGVVPKNMIKGTDLKNAWGGDLTIANEDANASFTITLSQIPKDECTQLAKFQLDAWLSVKVNDTLVEITDTIASIVGNCQASNNLVYEAR